MLQEQSPLKEMTGEQCRARYWWMGGTRLGGWCRRGCELFSNGLGDCFSLQAALFYISEEVFDSMARLEGFGQTVRLHMKGV